MILPLILIPLLFSEPARAQTQELVEVPVRRVLFPSNGYTDHDMIQIRAEGELPDPCYEFGETTVSRDAQGVFSIHPHAWRHSSDACDTGDMLGESPYSIDVSLGRLKAGDYAVAFAPDDDSTDSRKLRVASAPVANQGEARAAQVTSFDLRQIVLEGQEVLVTLRGLLSSPCRKIADKALVRDFGDTIVLSALESESCASSGNGTYEKTVSLGIRPPREYLVQIRGQNGQILEQTFAVVRTHSAPARLREAKPR
jgi:hypothetical protein